MDMVDFFNTLDITYIKLYKFGLIIDLLTMDIVGLLTIDMA